MLELAETALVLRNSLGTVSTSYRYRTRREQRLQCYPKDLFFREAKQVTCTQVDGNEATVGDGDRYRIESFAEGGTVSGLTVLRCRQPENECGYVRRRFGCVL